jgi:hypothetical protein
MPSSDDTADLRRQLTHAEAVIAELRGVVAALRKQVEAHEAHIHRLVRISFGRGGERVEGPTLFDGMVAPDAEVPTRVAPRPRTRLRRRGGRATAGGASRRTCRAAEKRST